MLNMLYPYNRILKKITILYHFNFNHVNKNLIYCDFEILFSVHYILHIYILVKKLNDKMNFLFYL